MEKKYNLIQSVCRAISILELFTSETTELGVTAISKSLGLHKSTCFGLLYTLQQLGYIQQDSDTGRYKLGLKTFQLGQAYIRGTDLRQLARPYLRELMEQTQETLHLVILEGNRAVYVDKVEGPHAMTISSRIGQRAMLHCTGVGKALMAHMPEEEWNSLLGGDLKSFTEHTITDKDRLAEHLHTIRQRGYSIDDQEIEIGLRCVAAPIFDASGRALAAISLSGPVTRIDNDKLEELSRLIRKAADDISRQLGYRKS